MKSKLWTLLLALISQQALANTYYVSTSGLDSNPGTSSAPFRTITYAYGKASAGDTLLVGSGTYTDYQSGWGLRLGKNSITLKAQVRGQAIIQGGNKSDRNVGVNIDGSSNILDGFVITGGPKGGISIWGNGNQILRSEIHHNGNVLSTSQDGQDGIYSNEGTSGNRYEQNYIHDNGRIGSVNGKFDHGLYLSGNNEFIANNISVKNAGMGLQIAGYQTVTNMKVYYNVFSFNGTSGMVIWQAINGLEIKNNIISNNQRFGIYNCGATGPGVVLDHNLFYGNNASHGGYFDIALSDQCGSGGNTLPFTLGATVTNTPGFKNASGSFSLRDDFMLSVGSAALSSAIPLATVPADIAGTSRCQGQGCDLGAYEGNPVFSEQKRR